jgi:hypothetical protein
MKYNFRQTEWRWVEVMCSVWEGGLEGVEEGRPASLRLPTSLAAVQALPSGLLVLLDQVRPYSYRAYVSCTLKQCF